MEFGGYSCRYYSDCDFVVATRSNGSAGAVLRISGDARLQW